jgi:hypothetical protein
MLFRTINLSLDGQIVIADLPRAGLCNMLHVWARALVFASQNRLPLYVHGWQKMRIGPYLRGERSKRRYGNYFKHNTTYLLYTYFRLLNPGDILLEPNLQPGICKKRFRAAVFRKYPNVADGDIFSELAPHKQLIKESFFNMLKDHLSAKLTLIPSPEIGVHVRRGDFKQLQLATDDEYFVTHIKAIRQRYGKSLSAAVFSDGFHSELERICALPNTQLVRNSLDILDLIQLSRSKFFVLSPRSTFSLWAAFLGEGLVAAEQRI